MDRLRPIAYEPRFRPGSTTDPQQLNHAIIVVPSNSNIDVEPIIDGVAKHFDNTPAYRWTVRVPGQFVQHHIAFDTDLDSVRNFRRQLHGVHLELEKVPRRVLPRFSVPEDCEAADHDFVAWMSFLYFLAWRDRDHTLAAELLYVDSARFDRPQEWVTGQCGEFCPRPYFTLTNVPKATLAEHQTGSDGSGRPFPQAFVAFLTKDLLYCSINAVRLFAEKAMRATEKTKPRQPRRTTKDRISEFAIFLEQHHSRQSGDHWHTPLTQDEVVKKLARKSWDANAVGRAFRRLFKDMHNYKDWCRTGCSLQVLNELRKDVLGPIKDGLPKD